MEPRPLAPESFSTQCYCGKSFSQPSALSNHTRTCLSSTKRLSSALGIAKDAWTQRQNLKRQRLNPEVAAVASAVAKVVAVPLFEASCQFSAFV